MKKLICTGDLGEFWRKKELRMCDEKFPVRLDRKIIYESDWVSLYLDKVKMPGGQIIPTYHQLHYPHASVSCVILNEQDEILMIKSKRYTTNRLEWEIPAGGIEENETPQEAARRECMEETGCTLKDLTFLSEQNPSNGMSDLKIYMFGARVDTENTRIDMDEVSGKQWMTKSEVLDMLKNNEIYCGVSIANLLYAIQFYI